MMTNCPRCGFYQTQDQYCAKCGVDMVAYRPTQKPLLQRVLRNSVFQLLALLLLIAVLISFARNLRHRDVEERIAEVESSRPTQVLSRHVDEKKTELDSTSQNQPHPASIDEPKGTSSSATAAVPAATATPEDDGKPAAPKAASSARIVFASISKTALDALVAQADPRSVSSQGPIVSGVVTNLAGKIKTAQAAEDWSILEQSARPIHANQVVEYYGGTKDETNNQFFGFVIELTPLQAEDTETTLQLRAWRYLRDGLSPQAEEFSIPLPESFQVPTNGGVFITGALPKRALPETERHFYEPIKVLNLLSNDDYRRGASELVIFVEPK